MSGTVINDNKRYLRFSRAHSHPAWLGYQDRYLFPAYEPEPSFFFIRKMNILGELFDERKLVSWIKDSHFNMPEHSICTLEDASVMDQCLSFFAKDVAINNEVIIIPTNIGYEDITNNLLCSLSHFQIKNILYWSLDHLTHDKLLKKGLLSVFFPGFPTVEDMLEPDDKLFTKVFRYKPRLISNLLKLGFDVWYLDADTVALEDFRPHATLDYSADIFITLDEKYIPKRETKPLTSTMYFRNSETSVEFVRRWVNALDITQSFDDLRALKWLLKDTKKHQILFEKDYTKNNVSSASKNEKNDVPVNVQVSAIKSPENDTNKIDVGSRPVQQYTRRGSISPRHSITSSTLIYIRALDPLLFINSIFFQENSPIPSNLIMPVFIHGGLNINNEIIFSEWDMWYMEGNLCKWKNSRPQIEINMNKKGRI